ncbi:MAG: hypothetical protein HS102_08775 [Planctomycetia bacterium]|nr:MAG: hypothetical protein EDS66_03760 [Planctomycetota bacterium]MBE7456706.1 hypothetical protein [Planctomycetia bacterium]
MRRKRNTLIATVFSAALRRPADVGDFGVGARAVVDRGAGAYAGVSGNARTFGREKEGFARRG